MAGGIKMGGDRERFLAILKEKSYEKRKVILSSGRESDFYIDCKQATLDAEGAVLTGRILCEMLAKDGMPEAVGVITSYSIHYTKLYETLVVNPERMKKNIAGTHGLLFSQRVMLALAARGLSRERAYEVVQKSSYNFV